MEWRRASFCASGECVEMGEASDYGVTFAVLVRDGKDRDGPVLEFTPEAWAEFTAGIRAGDFS